MRDSGDNQNPDSSKKVAKRLIKERTFLPPSLVKSKVEVERRPPKEKLNPHSFIEPKVKLARRPRKE